MTTKEKQKLRKKRKARQKKLLESPIRQARAAKLPGDWNYGD